MKKRSIKNKRNFIFLVGKPEASPRALEFFAKAQEKIYCIFYI